MHYPPGAFGQNNLEIAQLIIEHVREQIPAGSRVAEFYAGVGAIGLSVLQQVGEISMNELSPSSLHGLELGLAQLSAAERAKISLIPGEAGCRAIGRVRFPDGDSRPASQGLESGTRGALERPSARQG